MILVEMGNFMVKVCRTLCIHGSCLLVIFVIGETRALSPWCQVRIQNSPLLHVQPDFELT